MLKTMCVSVEAHFCEECSLSLRRFIGGLEGIESIEANNGQISITYEDKIVNDGQLFAAVCENVEKLGYKLLV